MRLGVFAKTFTRLGAENVLSAVKESGFDCAQFNMACVGLSPLPEEIPNSVIDEIRLAEKTSGVAISAISATYNMIHPDLNVRRGGLIKLEVILKAAQSLGIELVTLCTGSCDPDDQWRHHPENQSEQSWRSLGREIEKAVLLAEKYQTNLGIEPELANVVNSAAAARRLLDETNSKYLKIIFDPVNLFESNEASQQTKIISQAVELLRDEIMMAHAKDRDSQRKIVAVGQGTVDFQHFIKCLNAIGFNGPLITHGLNASEAPGVSQYLKRLLSEL
jgi:sugar phosphate isomerase/epimerase